MSSEDVAAYRLTLDTYHLAVFDALNGESKGVPNDGKAREWLCTPIGLIHVED